MSTTNGGPTPASRTVRLGNREVTIERVSGRKASRAFAELKAVGKAVPELVNSWGRFQAEYESTHSVELDRAQAEFRYGPEPLVREGELVRYPEDHRLAGEPVMVPGPLASMTEESWAAAGNKLRLPRSPSFGESLAAIMPDALEVAEEHVYRLLALFTMENADVKAHRKDGTLPTKLDELADELLDDAGADELLELAVVCGEVVEDQFVSKTEELGDRLGNALRLLGMDPAKVRAQTTPQGPQTTDSTTPPEEEPSTATSSPSNPTSSTDSPAPGDGPPTSSSTNPSTSSALLDGDSTPRELAPTRSG